MRLVPYEFTAASHDSCGFESRAWKSFFKFGNGTSVSSKYSVHCV